MKAKQKMIKHLNLGLCISFFLIYSGCTKEEITKTETSFSTATVMAEAPMRKQLGNSKKGGANALNFLKNNVERKLIKEGNIEFETKNIAMTRQQIFDSIKKLAGYVAFDEEYKSPGKIKNVIRLRVPAEKFNLLLDAVAKDATRFDSKRIHLRDVTEQFLDFKVRLNTKKQLEKRYLELLKKAKNVIEIVEVEKQISQLRGEIESLEGRFKYLNNKVIMSTLTVSFYQVVSNEESEQDKFSNKFINGFKKGWENFIWFILALISIWPFLLITIFFLTIFFGGILALGRKVKRSKYFSERFDE